MTKEIEDGGPAFRISHIELLCLKKLSLVSHALASKLDYRAREEQTTLARTLDDVIRRYELLVASKEPSNG